MNRCTSCGRFAGAAHTCPQVRHESLETASLDFLATQEIESVEDLLAYCGVDTERHRILKTRLSGYPIQRKGGYVEQKVSVRATLEPLVDNASEGLVEELIARAKEYAPRYPPPSFALDLSYGEHLLELDLFDFHVQMLAWGAETDGGNWDSKTADLMFRSAVERLVSLSKPFPIDRILLPIGNDLFHADQQVGGQVGGQTTAGTPQDVDTRRKKGYIRVFEMVRDTVDMLHQIAPVDVVIVPGNHDEDTAFTLGHSLECWYHREPAVIIYNGPTLRKYYQYGNTLLGFTHGKHEPIKNLPLTMADEVPDMWVETDFHEWHIGHKHSASSTTFKGNRDLQGVRVRVIPSLAPNDAWHYRKAYRSQRAAEAYLWHRENGFVGNFSVSVPRRADEL